MRHWGNSPQSSVEPARSMLEDEREDSLPATWVAAEVFFVPVVAEEGHHNLVRPSPEQEQPPGGVWRPQNHGQGAVHQNLGHVVRTGDILKHAPLWNLMFQRYHIACGRSTAQASYRKFPKILCFQKKLGILVSRSYAALPALVVPQRKQHCLTMKLQCYRLPVMPLHRYGTIRLQSIVKV